jgi:hypothetical protein
MPLGKNVILQITIVQNALLRNVMSQNVILLNAVEPKQEGHETLQLC